MQSLNGVNYRIEADAPLEDLEKIERKQIETEKRGLDTKLKKRIGTHTTSAAKSSDNIRLVPIHA